jgi:hypothetical protein
MAWPEISYELVMIIIGAMVHRLIKSSTRAMTQSIAVPGTPLVTYSEGMCATTTTTFTFMPNPRRLNDRDQKFSILFLQQLVTSFVTVPLS